MSAEGFHLKNRRKHILEFNEGAPRDYLYVVEKRGGADKEGWEEIPSRDAFAVYRRPRGSDEDPSIVHPQKKEDSPELLFINLFVAQGMIIYLIKDVFGPGWLYGMFLELLLICVILSQINGYIIKYPRDNEKEKLDRRIKMADVFNTVIVAMRTANRIIASLLIISAFFMLADFFVKPFNNEENVPTVYMSELEKSPGLTMYHDFSENGKSDYLNYVKKECWSFIVPVKINVKQSYASEDFILVTGKGYRPVLYTEYTELRFSSMAEAYVKKLIESHVWLDVISGVEIKKYINSAFRHFEALDESAVIYIIKSEWFEEERTGVIVVDGKCVFYADYRGIEDIESLMEHIAGVFV